MFPVAMKSGSGLLVALHDAKKSTMNQNFCMRWEHILKMAFRPPNCILTIQSHDLHFQCVMFRTSSCCGR
jgi:hypothetical protein